MSYLYFAWVDETDTIFDPHFQRVDEIILSYNLKHDEGQIPTLNLTIKNPRVGLLSPHRKVWAWFSRDDGTGHVTPLFFGVLVGIPSNLFKETIDIKLISRSPNYIQNKQAVAETMKVRPYWDPVFLDLAKRDDPDSILEGWSALWHIDRVTLAVTSSDILTGEDGTVVFTGHGDAFYDSVSMEIGEAPLTNIQVQATVNWTQRTTNYLDGPQVDIASYTGDTFLGDWPKPGASLGGGWRVENSFVNDVYMVAQTPNAHISTSWEDKSNDLGDCDGNSTSSSANGPALLSPNPIAFLLTMEAKDGECDPAGTPPINKPTSGSYTGQIIPQWFLNCTWNLRYDAKREYSEKLTFNIISNLQSILTSPTVQQNTELITINGSNVGEPLIELEAWSDFAGQSVPLAQMITPNNPTTPGGLSYQVCVVPGIAGSTEPVFSDIPGTITYDGGVQWASMGLSPLTTQPNWSDSTFVSLGEIIFYVPKVFNLASGDWEPSLYGTYLLCTNPGETNSTYQQFSYVTPIIQTDEPTPAPIIVSFIPGPNTNIISGSGIGWIYPGSDIQQENPFDSGAGVYGNIIDGSVAWTDLGASPAMFGIPIGQALPFNATPPPGGINVQGGTTPLEVMGNNYFPTDRGLWSVEHLIMKARTRLRLRARVIKVSWDCPIENVVGLSCRMNASLNDTRLPGGSATGKIISYSMTGKDGKERGHVEIGVAVGYGGFIHPVDGVPCYVDSYFDYDVYEQWTGSTVSLGIGDIGYTPPQYVSFDDGLVFPLQTIPGIKSAEINGTTDAQLKVITKAIPTAQYVAGQEQLLNWAVTSDTGDQSVTTTGGSNADFWFVEQLIFKDTAISIPYVMEANPVSYEVFINPVTNGPFNGSYEIEITSLEIPMGIDLQASSNI